MLVRRLRRRHNNKTTLGQCLVIAGSVAGGLATFPHPSLPHLTQRVMLRNITIRSWLRYLSPKNAKFVLLKLVKGIAH